MTNQDRETAEEKEKLHISVPFNSNLLLLSEQERLHFHFALCPA